MKILKTLAAFLLLAPVAYGFGEPVHSKVEIVSTADGDNLEFTFKISPNSGHMATFEGPWKLELKNHDGLTFASSALNRDSLDEKLPGYKVKTSAQPAKPAGEFEYSLISFICTTDKTQCYREVHKGKHAWKK